MESRLIQEIRLEVQMNKLLKQIEYQLVYLFECNNKRNIICRQCIYNVGVTIPICSKNDKQQI